MTESGGPVAASADALRAELRALCGAARALVEWHESTGVLGLPSEGPADAVLDSLSPSQGSRAAPVRRPAPAPSPAFTPPSPAFTPPSPAAAAVAPPAPGRAPAAPIAAPLVQQAPARASAAGVGGSDPLVPDDERRLRLALLAEEVSSCQRCSLHLARKQTVFSRGNPFAELVFIGEGPGAEEDAQGQPFVGPAGQLLDKMIVAMGFARDDVYVCNIVKCRPPGNRKPEPPEMAACTPYLATQLGLVRPKVMVALGTTAVEGLLGLSGGITRLRGTWKLYKGTIPVMPTFHPAYLLRTPAAKKEVWEDLKKVMKHLGR